MSKKSKIRCGGLVYLMSFVLVLAVTGTASADQQAITVPDAGFDDHVLAEGDWVYIGEGPYAETSDYTGKTISTRFWTRHLLKAERTH
jgi:hypothetical protein